VGFGGIVSPLLAKAFFLRDLQLLRISHPRYDNTSFYDFNHNISIFLDSKGVKSGKDCSKKYKLIGTQRIK
jgi:hypothetical protein